MIVQNKNKLKEKNESNYLENFINKIFMDVYLANLKF